MATKFKIAGGTVAIYEATDDLPFSDPYTYLSRVKFHSLLRYIGLDAAVPTIDTTVSLPSGKGAHTQSITLGAHGKGSAPFVFGAIQVDSVWQPWVGAVPVWHAVTTGASPGYSRVRTLSLTVDGTNIYAFARRSSDTFSYSAVSVPVKVWVSAEMAP